DYYCSSYTGTYSLIF
nr:immunoglobulin light chain junction region [Macaca mulatta]